VTTYYNTEASDTFGSIYMTDKNKYSVLQVSSTVSLQNKYPAMITQYSLKQDSYV